MLPARSQGFIPSDGAALDKLASELAEFHHRFRDDRGQVRLTYSTRLYIANSASHRV